jgi:hypothetical protein
MPPGVSDSAHLEEGIRPKVTRVFNQFRDLGVVLTVVHPFVHKMDMFHIAQTTEDPLWCMSI